MRDYSKIGSSVWTGKTGKALRGDADAQIVSFYLMTTHHATMIGVFHCPLLYISHETGRSMKGALKGLHRCIEVDFCTFDEASEVVWVHNMARYQIGESLSPGDKRVKGVQKAYESISQTSIRKGFFERYGQAFHLTDIDGGGKGRGSPFEGPSKPVTVAVTGTDPSQEIDPTTGEVVSLEARRTGGAR